MWRILQIKVRPLWITPYKICRILHILRKPNSIIALLFIQNISSFLKEFCHYALFFFSPNITQPCLQVFSINSSIICSGLHFWLRWFNNFWWAPLLMSLIQYGEDSFQVWWTAVGYSSLTSCLLQIVLNPCIQKIFLHFWLAKTACIIFTTTSCCWPNIEPMTSKVQPSENYWTDDVKMTSKVQPATDY